MTASVPKLTGNYQGSIINPEQVTLLEAIDYQ